MNENGLHRLTGSGTIRRCGPVGGSVSLGVDFEVSEVLSLSADVGSRLELSASSPAPCLSLCHHASYHDDDGLNI